MVLLSHKIATGEKVENNHDPRRVRPSGMTYTEELVTWRCMQKMALGACVGICMLLLYFFGLSLSDKEIKRYISGSAVIYAQTTDKITLEYAADRFIIILISIVELGITFPISGIWVGYTHCKNEATKLLPEDSILRKKLDHREE